jgi:hypothetical protein
MGLKSDIRDALYCLVADLDETDDYDRTLETYTESITGLAEMWSGVYAAESGSDNCNECSADLTPHDGGEYGRHDYGCSQGPWPGLERTQGS